MPPRIGILCALTCFAQIDRYEQGGAFLRAGRLAEAEQAYRQHLRTHPRHVEALANLGAVLSRREEFAAAIEQYGRALQLRPDLAPLRLNLGLAYFKTRDWAKAVSEFDLYLKAQPGQRQAQQLRALALMELQQYREAATALEALLPSADVAVPLALATAYLRSDRPAEAQRILTPLLQQGTSAEVWLTVGQAFMAEERWDDALEALRKARDLQPELPSLRLHLGAVRWRQRQRPEALEEWRAEWKAHPNSAEAQFTLGTALAMTGGDKLEAERLLRASLVTKPRLAKANFQLAKLVWEKRSKEAVTCLERAVAADPDYREAHYLLGRIYQELGRPADAAREFATVQRLSAKELATQQDLFSEQP
ncbi:MAG: tetratricopeptide repeat protein [Bryobacteraceae bacterium]|nr:tetratricopeptide repeat protein [Bryobacteraceae bacterium]